jgi:acyl carrier protein
VPFIANAQGAVVMAGAEVPLTMFADSVRSTVRFADGLAAVRGMYPDALAIEVGPGQALSVMATAVGYTAVPLAAGGTSGELALALAGLWTRGLPINLAALIPRAGLVHLPSTAFGGERYIAPETQWPDPAPAPAPPTVMPGLREAQMSALTSPGNGQSLHPAGVIKTAWSELLGHTSLDAGSDFVALGGDSLTVVRLARRLEEAFAIEVPLRELMLRRTLGGQIRLVERLTAPSSSEVSDE